jgi:hypothetical protein
VRALPTTISSTINRRRKLRDRGTFSLSISRDKQLQRIKGSSIDISKDNHQRGYDLSSAKLKTATPARRMYQQGEELLGKDINNTCKKTISVKRKTSSKGHQEERRLQLPRSCHVKFVVSLYTKMRLMENQSSCSSFTIFYSIF